MDNFRPSTELSVLTRTNPCLSWSMYLWGTTSIVHVGVTGDVPVMNVHMATSHKSYWPGTNWNPLIGRPCWLSTRSNYLYYVVWDNYRNIRYGNYKCVEPKVVFTVSDVYMSNCWGRDDLLWPALSSQCLSYTGCWPKFIMKQLQQ